MSYKFRGCSSLTSLNLSNFNTNNVNNMSYMFSGCSSLISLNLSNFNTNNVEDMSDMFYYCSKLISINLSNHYKIKNFNLRILFGNISYLDSLNSYCFNRNEFNKLGNILKEC